MSVPARRIWILLLSDVGIAILLTKALLWLGMPAVGAFVTYGVALLACVAHVIRARARGARRATHGGG